MRALDGQVALVTGGTRGVGRAIAEAYAGEGATVVVNDRDRGVDYASEQASVEALVDHVAREHGRLDVLVLNPGGANGTEPVAAMSDDHWQSTLDRSLNHVFWGIRRALQHMLPHRSGRIVVTSAVEGKLPRPGASGYVAAMHAVGGLVKSVAREVGPEGVAVNAILTGPLEHPHELSKIGRPNTADEVARVAVLLASPSLTSVTGCMFPVDGGAMPY